MRFALASSVPRLRPPLCPLRPVLRARPSYLLVSVSKRSARRLKRKARRRRVVSSPIDDDEASAPLRSSAPKAKKMSALSPRWPRFRSCKRCCRYLIDTALPFRDSNRRNSTVELLQLAIFSLRLLHSPHQSTPRPSRTPNTGNGPSPVVAPPRSGVCPALPLLRLLERQR